MLTANYVVFMNAVLINGYSALPLVNANIIRQDEVHTVYTDTIRHSRLSSKSPFGTRGVALLVDKIIVFPRFIQVVFERKNTLIPQANIRHTFLDNDGSNYLHQLTVNQ